MKQLIKFDLYATAHPKSQDDVLALLREVQSELQNVNNLLDSAFAQCKPLSTAAAE